MKTRGMLKVHTGQNIKPPWLEVVIVVQRSIVQRLIAFLRRPDALSYEQRTAARPSSDDYVPYETGALPSLVEQAEVLAAEQYSQPDSAAREQRERLTAPLPPVAQDSAALPAAIPPAAGEERWPGYASRLDALVMRALHQFSARLGFVIRYDADGRMCYVTGRDYGGRYVDHTAINPDRRALSHTLRTGESNLFVQRRDNVAEAVLCGPLRVDGEVVGVLYLDGPARGRLFRGIFEIYCDQVARLLADGVA
jgi:GAF domain-containing protein